jgi:hypothetical protein
MQPSQKNSRSYEQCVEMCERIAAEHDWNGNPVEFKTWWTKADLYRKQRDADNGHTFRVTDARLEEEYEAMFGNPYGKAEMPRMEFREFFNPEERKA